MSLWKTIIAGIVFAAALGLLIQDQTRIQRAEERRVTESRLIPQAKENFESISIMRSGIPLELRKENENWRIIRPLLAEADRQAVADLITFLDKQTRTGGDKFKDGEQKLFGLDQPALTVTVGAQGTTEETAVQVGENSPAYGEVYARLQGAEEWFTISADLRDRLKRSLYDYRDKSLLTMDASLATTITLTHEGQLAEVMKRDGEWELTRPVSLAADGPRIEGILKEIQTTKAADFIDTETLQLDAYGLDAPSIVAALYQPDDKTPVRGTLLIGRRKADDKPTYYALRLGRDVVFTVPQSLVDALRPTVGDLRDKQIFNLKPEEVRRFSIQFGKQVDGSTAMVNLIKDSSSRWRFEDDSVTEVDQSRVTQRIGMLLRLRAQSFFEVQPLPEQTGLDAPIVRIVLGDVDGARNEGLVTGKLAENSKFVYARRVGSDEVFSLPAEVTSKFFLKREDFRDRTLFAFDPPLVEKIEVVEEAKPKVVFKHDAESWIGTIEGGPQYQVTPSTIQALILSLLSMQWEDELKPTVEHDATLIKTKGLDAPKRTISFLDAKGEALARIGQGQTDQTRVYIRRGEAEYFAVDSKKFERFVALLKDLIPRL